MLTWYRVFLSEIELPILDNECEGASFGRLTSGRLTLTSSLFDFVPFVLSPERRLVHITVFGFPHQNCNIEVDGSLQALIKEI
jgi:hypothetical protein